MATRSVTFNHLAHNIRLQRGLVFGAIIMTALFAFEAFNYGTTHYALSDLLGDLTFAGLSWATILAIAFCGIDFAGIARLFASENSRNHNDSWFLFGAWMLAATMNAMLTWWGVSLAILNHQSSGTVVLGREDLLRIVPVFVAIMVWLIRILMIGTFSLSGDRLFSSASNYTRTSQSLATPRQPVKAKGNDYNPIPATNSTRSNPAHLPTGRAPAFTSSPPSRSPAAPRTRTFTSPPQARSTPPEPEYLDDDQPDHPGPAYVPAPLAAKPPNKTPGAPGARPPTGQSPNSMRRF